jgi:PilZ domain
MSSDTIVRRETLTVRPTWKARMRALTRSGAYLLANRKVDVGARLRLRTPQGERVTLCVTRCAAQATGGWALSCRLEGAPGSDVLHTLQAPPSLRDERHTVRLPCATLARFHAGDGQDQGWARLADVSAHGACLMTEQPLSEGDILELELGADDEPVHAVGRVAYARQQRSGAWIVGCALRDELTEDDLWRLVSNAP